MVNGEPAPCAADHDGAELPSTIRQRTPAVEAVVIEYPGFVRNVDNALATLGGISAITSAVRGGSNILKLNFRPNDPTCHPLYGDRHPGCALLLRIARRRPAATVQQTADSCGTNDSLPSAPNAPTSTSGPHPMDIDGTNGDAEADLLGNPLAPPRDASAGDAAPPAGDQRAVVTAEIVARITTVYRFSGMADYQYVSHDGRNPASVIAAAISRGAPQANRSETAEPSGTPHPMMLVPPIFSKVDMPQDYSSQLLHDAQGEAGPAAEQVDLPHIVSFFCAAIPEPTPGLGVETAEGVVASSSSAPPAAPPGLRPSSLRSRLVALLDERPVWLLQTLQERLEEDDKAAGAGASRRAGDRQGWLAELEVLLRDLCYRFKTGPWKLMHIRRGYDPRTDRERARALQGVFYRLPNDWYAHSNMTAARQALEAGRTAGPHGKATPPDAAEPPRSTPDPRTAPSADVGGDDAVTAAATAASPEDGPAATAHAAQQRFLDARADVASHSSAVLHSFQAVPMHRTSLLQLADVQDAEVQQILRDAPQPTRCTEATGWFRHNSLTQISRIVAARFGVLLGTPPERPSTHDTSAAAVAAAATGDSVGPADPRITTAAATAATPAAAAASGRAAEGVNADALAEVRRRHARQRVVREAAEPSAATAAPRRAAAVNPATAASVGTPGPPESRQRTAEGTTTDGGAAAADVGRATLVVGELRTAETTAEPSHDPGERPAPPQLQPLVGHLSVAEPSASHADETGPPLQVGRPSGAAAAAELPEEASSYLHQLMLQMRRDGAIAAGRFDGTGGTVGGGTGGVAAAAVGGPGLAAAGEEDDDGAYDLLEVDEDDEGEDMSEGDFTDREGGGRQRGEVEEEEDDSD